VFLTVYRDRSVIFFSKSFLVTPYLNVKKRPCKFLTIFKHSTAQNHSKKTLELNEFLTVNGHCTDYHLGRLGIDKYFNHQKTNQKTNLI